MENGNSETVKHVVDARGLACPMPTVRLAQAMRGIAVGELLELWTDDAGSPANMAAWTRNTGHPLVREWSEAGMFKYRVRRGR
jgi:tRNA 2-thiouridine synthesizing protein A